MKTFVGCQRGNTAFSQVENEKRRLAVLRLGKRQLVKTEESTLFVRRNK